MKAIAKDFENYEKCGPKKKGKKRVFFFVYKREESIFMKSISKES